MSSIACTRCGEPFQLGTPGWLTVIEQGVRHPFCTLDCLLKWATERKELAK